MDLCQLCTQHDPTGSMLCLGCTKATLVRLECLPALYDGLLPFLAPSSAIGQGRTGKGGPAPLPVREEILDLRGPGGMVGIVESWLAAVHQDRGWAPRVPFGSVEGRLDTAVSGLRRNMPWIAVSWEQAGTFAGEIRDLVRDVQSIVAPAVAQVRGTRVGACPAVHDDGGVCGAVLRLGHGERVVTCAWCHTSYPPATWEGLKVLIDEDAAA
ncbi:hypothetical protein ACIRD6_13410 [Streptomyces sp. NPDC102473]|uniref:hypothetical protein n=1 Tax=Streptomyces sp. NPDC102473 TaxID=3366180 RepID=UPI0038060CAF